MRAQNAWELKQRFPHAMDGVCFVRAVRARELEQREQRSVVGDRSSGPIRTEIETARRIEIKTVVPRAPRTLRKGGGALPSSVKVVG